MRIAFDGDAVIFGDESERISRESGIEAFHANESERALQPLEGGPFRGFLAALQRLQSSRAEILMTLGAPDRRLLDDRVFGYRWSEALATVVFPAGYQVGGFTVSENRLMLIEFTPQGGTIHVRIDIDGGDARLTPVPHAPVLETKWLRLRPAGPLEAGTYQRQRGNRGSCAAPRG